MSETRRFPLLMTGVRRALSKTKAMSASSTCCASHTISKAALIPFEVGPAPEPRVVVSQIAISRLILPVGREAQTAKLTRRRTKASSQLVPSLPGGAGACVFDIAQSTFPPSPTVAVGSAAKKARNWGWTMTQATASVVVVSSLETPSARLANLFKQIVRENNLRDREAAAKAAQQEPPNNAVWSGDQSELS